MTTSETHSPMQRSKRLALLILHPAFVVTGVIQAVSGPMLPALATAFHFTDSTSGLLLTFYFCGTALGALFCRGHYSRIIAWGFLALMAICLGVAVSNRVTVFPLFLVMGVAVGASNSAVSLYVGRNFATRCAPTLSFLNFTWSAGALAAPLLAAMMLARFNFRGAYCVVAGGALLMAVASFRLPQDAAEEPRAAHPTAGSWANLRLIVLVGFLAFLENGVENTSITWLTTYAERAAGLGMAAAAASSSLYWCGFLSSRLAASLLLLRVEAMRVFRFGVGLAMVSGTVLAAFPSLRGVAMFGLGVAVAPLFPVLLSLLFARIRHTSDTRWVLAASGFGGSILPWLTGWISVRTGSLSLGLMVIPAAMGLIACLLPLLGAGKVALVPPMQESRR